MSKKKGLKIGSYRITPLGLCVLAVILLIILAVIVLFVNPFNISGEDSYYTQWTATATPTPSPTPTPTPTPSPTPTPEPTPRAATIRILGEITADNDILAACGSEGSYDFSDCFSYATDLMSDADYTIGTVQGSLGGTVDASGSKFYRTPASMITALKDAGVDMLDLAVDHALDGNFDDLFAGIANCQNTGMDYVGAATSESEKKAPRVVEINGIKVGFIAYTSSINGLQKKVDSGKLKYGINFISKKTNPKTDIQACQSSGAELIVVFMGWGTPGDRNISATQQKLAQYLCDAGADVIVGYDPGVIQGASWLETKDSSGTVTHRALCVPALGNFLSGNREQYQDSGVVLQFTIEETSTGLAIANPVYIPTYVWRQGEEGSYKFHTLAVGQWLETAPEDMNYKQFTRIKEVWAEAQSIMGTSALSVYSGVGDITSTAASVGSFDDEATDFGDETEDMEEDVDDFDDTGFDDVSEVEEDDYSDDTDMTDDEELLA